MGKRLVGLGLSEVELSEAKLLGLGIGSSAASSDR